MTNTAESINELREFKKEVNDKMLNREIVSFNINAIDIDKEIMTVDGVAFSEEATKKVLSRLRVKNNFLGLHKELTPTDWNLVKDKIKQASANQVIFGRKVENDTVKKIDDIYMAAPKALNTLELNAIFEEVVDSLVSSAKDISIKSMQFLEDKDEVSITLLENDFPVDIFANGTDMWKTGKKIVWNGMTFSIAAFFERLVCSNGNTAPQYGFKANISNNKFNLDRIKKVLEKEITLQSDVIDSYLIDAANHLKSTNISVREFLKVRAFFNESDHAEILKKWFDESSLNKAYGCVVSEMPDLWKTSADSGKNAYDFFNDVTYIASHPADAILTNRERTDLQIKASDILFKKSLDLELIAPKVKWN